MLHAPLPAKVSSAISLAACYACLSTPALLRAASPENYSAATAPTTADAQRLIADHDGWHLFLHMITTLTPDVAEVLAKHRGLMLDLNGLADITPSVAEKLAAHEGRALSLSGLKQLSPEVATALAKYRGRSLYLDGLSTLSTESATLLATYTGKHLRLTGLEAITPEVAKALIRYRGHLWLSRSEHVSKDCAAILEAVPTVHFGEAGALSRQETSSMLAKIDPDQELSLTDFKALYGHVSAEPLTKIVSDLTVCCGIEFQEIRDIDAANGSFTARGFLWYYWEDMRFAFNASGADSLKWRAETLRTHAWIPEIEFDNGSGEVRRWGETLEVFPDGDVECWFNFVGTFTDQDGVMDFRLFPCETLPVAIDVTLPYRASQVSLALCRESTPETIIEELKKRRHPEFLFKAASVQEHRRSYTSEWGRDFSVLRVTVFAKRSKGYYLIHIVLPVAAILVVFLFGQRISIDEFEARIGLALTCLLSLIAYTFSFADSLPKIGYLTLLDYYITGNYCLIAAGTVMTCIQRWRPAAPDWLRRITRVGESVLPWCASLFILCACGVLMLV